MKKHVALVAFLMIFLAVVAVWVNRPDFVMQYLQPSAEQSISELDELRELLTSRDNDLKELNHTVEVYTKGIRDAARRMVEFDRSSEKTKAGTADQREQLHAELLEMVSHRSSVISKRERVKSQVIDGRSRFERLERQIDMRGKGDRLLITETRAILNDSHITSIRPHDIDPVLLDQLVQQEISAAQDELRVNVPKPPPVAFDGVEQDIHSAINAVYQIWSKGRRLEQARVDLVKFSQIEKLKDLVPTAESEIRDLELVISEQLNIYRERVSVIAEYDPTIYQESVQRYMSYLAEDDVFRRSLIDQILTPHVETVRQDPSSLAVLDHAVLVELQNLSGNPNNS